MSNTLAPIKEVEKPKFDHDFDIRAWVGTEANPLNDFFNARPAVLVNPGNEQSTKMIFFTKLDYVTRIRIYGYVFEHNPAAKMIKLSERFATLDVFPPDYFLTPWDLLHLVKDALFTCRQMRDELLTFFWTFYKFHVTFSPFTLGPTYSGLSIKWLNLYADRVNHLAVEVDLTKLGFGAAQNAVMLNRVTDKIKNTLSTLVKAIGARREKHHMADLHLMIRRYKGFRPPVHGASISTANVPYCPEEALNVFDCFSDLKDLVLEFRMTGFSYKYTKKLGIKMWRVLPKTRPWLGPAWPNYVRPPPLTPHLSHASSQKSRSRIQLKGPATDVSLAPATTDLGAPILDRSLTQSRRYTGISLFDEDYHNPFSGDKNLTDYASSVSSSNASSQSGPVESFKGGPGWKRRLESLTGLGIVIETAPKQIYQGSFDPKVVQRSTATCSKGNFTDDTTLRTAHKDDLPQVLEGRDSLITALQLPDAINELNEQDPAFLRALGGLKLSPPEIPEADENENRNKDEHDGDAKEAGAASNAARSEKFKNDSSKSKNKKGKGKAKRMSWMY